MRPDAILRSERSESLQPRRADGLIANHFDQAYFIFNIFVDDARTCLDLADCIFRGLEAMGGGCEREFYQAMVRTVRDLPEKNEVVPGQPTESVLCWLLKDSVDFNYAEIAGLMGYSRGQVRDAIAAVRFAVLI